MADGRKALGAAGEQAAARTYERAGYVVLDRNWRVRDGELDLVLGRAGVLVFCEVKTRGSARFGAPVEAVTPGKAQRIRRLAAQWLAAHPAHRGRVRFDVAAVTRHGDGTVSVELLEGCF